ncbi:MAG: preprotein translocase subunit SecG [Pirellulales bacterium]|nr:preprotein translocase subunit SecG [Pirellulales bacterium]
MRYLLGFLLFFMASLLILIVLVQRGRGGGLTGALGGPGGQSAFGSKAGDLFTKITVWVAGLWILLCIASIKILSGSSSALVDKEQANPNAESTESGQPAEGGAGTGGTSSTDSGSNE